MALLIVLVSLAAPYFFIDRIALGGRRLLQRLGLLSPDTTNLFVGLDEELFAIWSREASEASAE